MTTKFTSIALFAIATVATVAAPAAMAAECLQDQYGNQYTLSYDTDSKSISGTALVVQRSNETWTISGNYSGKKPHKGYQQVTMADSANSNTLYMLMGEYPNFQWFYNGSNGGQAATWVSCTSPVQPSLTPSANGRNGVN